MKNYGSNLKYIWGINLVIFGLVILGDIYGWHTFSFGNYIGLFILLPGIASLILNGPLISNIIVSLIGAALFIALNFDNINVPVVAAVLIIVVGLLTIFGNHFKGIKRRKD